MLKKFGSYILYAMIYEILFIILGVILISYPEISITIVIYALSFFLIINGLLLLFKNERKLFIDFTMVGTISLIFGIVIFIKPSVVTTIVPILLGIWMIIDSVFKLKISLVLKNCKVNSWMWTMLLSVLNASCGIIMIFNPQLASISLMTYLGILILLSSICSLVSLIIIYCNINNISKNYKKLEK